MGVHELADTMHSRCFCRISKCDRVQPLENNAGQLSKHTSEEAQGLDVTPDSCVAFFPDLPKRDSRLSGMITRYASSDVSVTRFECGSVALKLR